MDKKREKTKEERVNPGINQFIIECMFNKYFEEQKENKVVSQKEEVKI